MNTKARKTRKHKRKQARQTREHAKYCNTWAHQVRDLAVSTKIYWTCSHRDMFTFIRSSRATVIPSSEFRVYDRRIFDPICRLKFTFVDWSLHREICFCWDFDTFFFFNWDSLHARLKSHSTIHGVTRKGNTKRLRHTGYLFRKNLQWKCVC